MSPDLRPPDAVVRVFYEPRPTPTGRRGEGFLTSPDPPGAGAGGGDLHWSPIIPSSWRWRIFYWPPTHRGWWWRISVAPSPCRWLWRIFNGPGPPERWWRIFFLPPPSLVAGIGFFFRPLIPGAGVEDFPCPPPTPGSCGGVCHWLPTRWSW